MPHRRSVPHQRPNYYYLLSLESSLKGLEYETPVNPLLDAMAIGEKRCEKRYERSYDEPPDEPPVRAIDTLDTWPINGQ